MSFISLILSDYNKYKKYGSNIITIIFLTQGFWATVQYRCSNFIFINVKNKLLRKLFLIPFVFWQKIIEIITGISIPYSSTIGHSFYIGHFGNIILNSSVVIGNNCNISQGVTIGVSGIGENVYMGANAVIVGKSHIGNHVLVAACSLVNRNIYDNSIAIGVPAVVVSNKGSEGYI